MVPEISAKSGGLEMGSWRAGKRHTFILRKQNHLQYFVVYCTVALCVALKSVLVEGTVALSKLNDGRHFCLLVGPDPCQPATSSRSQIYELDLIGISIVKRINKYVLGMHTFLRRTYCTVQNFQMNSTVFSKFLVWRTHDFSMTLAQHVNETTDELLGLVKTVVL